MMGHAMIVDDSRAIRGIIGNTLKELGFEVASAGNGREALEQLSGLPELDLFLVDWNMPEMNGYEFLQAVRQEAQWDKVPVVMVTTETEFGQMERALAAGANEYIMKPFTRDVLREKLQLLGFACE